MKKPTIEENVFTALGEASMCWSETPKGVFDSNKAVEIGNVLVDKIYREFDPIGTVIRTISKDPDVYYAWQANIAMAFNDEFKRFMEGKTSEQMTEVNIGVIANNAAKNFLNLLCANVVDNSKDPEKIEV